MPAREDLTNVVALSVPEVSRATGFGQTTIWKNIRERRLLAKKCGTRTLVLRQDLEKFLADLPAVGEAA